MSRDYKNSGTPSRAKPSSSGSSGGGSIWAGLLIGLFIGVAVAVAAALYLNKTPNPFSSSKQVLKPEPVAEAPKPQPKTAPEVLKPQGASNASAPGGQSKDRFDFYTMLPDLGDKKEPELKPQPEAKPSETPPPASVTPPKGSYLQVGSFQKEEDADNLKAKLALMGVEANIFTMEVEGKGVMHRVRIGPLATVEDIDRLRSQLRVNGLDSALVKSN